MSFSLGVIDASTVAEVVKEATEEEKARQAALAARPPLENIINMHDFEVIAKAVIPEKAWVCYTAPTMVSADRIVYTGVLLFRIG